MKIETEFLLYLHIPVHDFEFRDGIQIESSHALAVPLRLFEEMGYVDETKTDDHGGKSLYVSGCISEREADEKGYTLTNIFRLSAHYANNNVVGAATTLTQAIVLLKAQLINEYWNRKAKIIEAHRIVQAELWAEIEALNSAKANEKKRTRIEQLRDAHGIVSLRIFELYRKQGVDPNAEGAIPTLEY